MEKEIVGLYQKFIKDLDSIISFARGILCKSVAGTLEDDLKRLFEGVILAKDNFVFDYNAIAKKYRSDAGLVDLMLVKKDIKRIETTLRNKLGELTELAQTIQDRYGELDVMQQIDFSGFLAEDNLKYEKILEDCKFAIKQNKKDPRIEAGLKRKEKLKEAKESLRKSISSGLENHLLIALKKVID